MKKPPIYINAKHGPIVDDFLNVAANGPTDSYKTGHLYKDEYDAIREKFETLREEDPASFSAVMNLMSGRTDNKEGTESAASFSININNETQKFVARDWAESNFDKSYMPRYMLDVKGRPCHQEIFKSVCGRIAKLWDISPEAANQLRDLAQNGTSIDNYLQSTIRQSGLNNEYMEHFVKAYAELKV